MTTVAVFVEPPESGVVLPGIVDSGLLTADEATELYGAMARDVCGAVEASGGELLVNYRPVAAEDPTDPDDEVSLREVTDAVSGGLEDPSAARYEIQVGSTYAARVGNTVTHLLEREEVATAAVVDPTAALLERRHVDGAAMKLRQSPVVLSPASEGRLAYAAFGAAIDFEDAFAAPAVETVTERARSADLDVDFLERVPVVERPRDLATLVSQVRARDRADKRVPPNTAATLDALGVRAEAGEDGLTVVRE